MNHARAAVSRLPLPVAAILLLASPAISCASPEDAFARAYMASAGIDVNDYSLFRFDYGALAAEAKDSTGRGGLTMGTREGLPPWANSATLRGSMRDLGFQVGSVAARIGLRPPAVDARARGLNLRIIDMYRRVFPPWLEKLEGIAEAFGARVEDMDLRFMEREFFVRLGWLGLDYETRKIVSFRMLGAGCSVALARVTREDGSRSVLVGRNFEWFQPNGTLFESSIDGLVPSSGMTIICPDHWVMDGVNARGLLVAVLTVGTMPEAKWGGLPYPDEPAIDTHHLMRIVLDSCGTVEEARALASSVRAWHGSENVHFVVADPTGAIELFEFGEDGRLVVDPMRERDFMVVTNDWMHGRSEVERLRCWRYAVGRELLRGLDPIRPDDVRRATMAMSNHPDNPLANFGFHPWYFNVLRTAWTSFYDLGSGRAEVDFREGHSIRFSALSDVPGTP